MNINQAQSELVERCQHLDGFLGVAVFDERRLVAIIDEEKPQVRTEIPSWIQGYSIACMPGDPSILEEIIKENEDGHKV